MISVDHVNIIMPQGIGKGINKEKILDWLGVYRMLQPRNRLSKSSWKRNIYSIVRSQVLNLRFNRIAPLINL